MSQTMSEEDKKHAKAVFTHKALSYYNKCNNIDKVSDKISQEMQDNMTTRRMVECLDETGLKQVYSRIYACHQ